MKRAIALTLATVLLLGYVAWLTRYQIASSGESPTVRAWQMDRWTGKMRAIFPNGTTSEWE